MYVITESDTHWSRNSHLFDSISHIAETISCWCLISRGAKQDRASNKVSGSLIARVLRSFLLEGSYRDRNANTKKRTTDGSSSGTVRHDVYMEVWHLDGYSWPFSLSLFFGVCPLLKPRVLVSTLLSLAYPRDTLDGRSVRREKSKRGLRRRGSATSATAERRERASSRSSEIVALPCLRASYRRYLFRRSAKQLAGPVGPANW